MSKPSVRVRRASGMSTVVVGLAAILALGACGSSSDDAAAPETNNQLDVAESVAFPSSAPESTTLEQGALQAQVDAESAAAFPAVDAPPTPTVPVDKLAADSATCKAFQQVADANFEASGVTNKFTAAMLAVDGSKDKTAVAAEWDSFRQEFAVLSAKIVPQLKGAYDTLSKEQPQFKEQLGDIFVVTEQSLGVMTKVDFNELATFQTQLIETVGTDKLLAAGESSLKIDAFSRAACGIRFAGS
jgi:hypothetical protein